MSFYGRFVAMSVLAGSGNGLSEEMLRRAPLNYNFKNVRLPKSSPRFDSAVYVRGKSMTHKDINDHDILLCVDRKKSSSYKVGDIVLFDASNIHCAPDLTHSEWRCVRWIEEVYPNGDYRVSWFDSVSDDVRYDDVPASAANDKVVAGFPSHAFSHRQS